VTSGSYRGLWEGDAVARVVVTRTVDAPVGLVWRRFADLAGRGTRLSDVESVEVLTPGEFGAGTRWRETRRAGRRGSVTEELVVVAAEPGRSGTIALAETGAPYRLTYTFTPIEVGPQRGCTTVSVVYEGSAHGLTNRFFSFFLGGFDARTVEGALRHDLDALAAACRRPGAAAA